MKTLIVFDSFFGNTETIAQSIAEGVKQQSEVELLRVTHASYEKVKEVDLIIIGSPTRAFKASPDIDKFFKKLPKNSLVNIATAAFDTRISPEDVDNRFVSKMVDTFGYAASAIAKKLKKKGGSLIVPPEGFIVNNTEGPNKDGEVDRAKSWGENLVSKTNHRV